jgi:hypothetical protein
MNSITVSPDPEIAAAVSEEDRRWFDRHPERKWRLRRARDGETATRPRWMVVLEITRGCRIRIPVGAQVSDTAAEYMAAHGTVELTLAGPLWLPDTQNEGVIQ